MKQPGRPKFEPTPTQRAQVTALVACGTRRALVAQYIGIDTKTLSRAFAKELKTAVADANARVASKLYAKAVAGDTVSMLFWLKCRGGWKEGSRLELTGPDGKPLPKPSLGISFVDGGPGRVRAEPYDQEADERMLKHLPPGIDVLPDADGVNRPAIPAPWPTPEKQAPKAEFIEAPDRPRNPHAELWARLGGK